MNPDVLDALVRVSDYMNAATSSTGELVCWEHGIDHTGRSSRSIVIDCSLHEATAEPRFLERAKLRAIVVAERLIKDPDHGAWIYHPGRLDSANNSNNVIDSGECTDALATLVLKLGDHADWEHTETMVDAITKNCQSYLVEAVVSKEVTNQRLWGAAGLAAAFKLIGDPIWKEAVLRSVERSMNEQHSDGSFPYHPCPAQFGIHEGAAGVSVYYQSRVLAFAAYALSLCGELESFRQPLETGLDFLRAASTPWGYKPLSIESKQWFWIGDIETGSHPYDIYALAAILTSKSACDDINVKCARLLETQDDDGAFRGAPVGDPGFLCRNFHTADVAWLARACEIFELQPDFAKAALPQDDKIRLFPEAGLIRIQSRETCALIAARSEPRNVLWGSTADYGEIFYLGYARHGWQNETVKPGNKNFGWSYSIRQSAADAIRATLRVNKPHRDLRFLVHIARSIWKSGRPIAACRLLIRTASQLISGLLGPQHQGRYWREWNVAASPDQVTLFGGLAEIDGTPVPGLTIRRTYGLDRHKLRVVETLECGSATSDIVYKPPHGIETLEVDSASSWKTHRGHLRFKADDLHGAISISYLR